MYDTSDFRRGLKIEIGGEPFIIVDFQHVKPGKGGAFVRTRLKSLVTGNVLDRTFRSGEKVDTPDLAEREMQYLYEEDDQFCFMDNKTYEQSFLTEEQLGEATRFLTENITVTILFHRSSPIGVELPTFVDLKIVKSEPGLRGDTASGGTKAVTLETGAVVQGPLFLNEGDTIRIDTRSGQYVERA